MPYITQRDRQALRFFNPLTPGELNYAITLLMIGYVKAHGKKYEVLNAVVGAVESAKAEFQRRVVAPYEDTKIAENGDVYPKELQ